MMFDNSPPPSPSTAEQVKRHLPIALAVLGVVGIAIGMHTALTAVVGLAVAHLVLAGVVGLVMARRNRRAAS